MKAHIEGFHKGEIRNTEDDDDDVGDPTDDDGTGDEKNKGDSDDEFKDCDPADGDDERNYDVTCGFPKGTSLNAPSIFMKERMAKVPPPSSVRSSRVVMLLILV